jgi:hypothetical protein
LVLALAVAVVLTGTGAARATVTLTDTATPANSASCANGSASAVLLLFGTPFKMAAPASAATGDIIMLTLRISNPINFLGNYSMPDGQSVKWTPLLSNGNTYTYYRIRQASDPTNYQLISAVAIVTSSVNVTASMTAFQGEDPATPLANAGAQSSGSGLGAIGMPNDAVSRGGSVRYSSLTTDDSNTFDYSASSPLAETCNQPTGNASVSASYEGPVIPATTPTRSITLGGSSPNWVAQTYVIQPGTCNTGGQTLTTPASVAFPATTLDGLDKMISATAPLTVVDATGTGAGWNVSGTSTTLASGGNTMPTDATSIVAVGMSPTGANCSLPTNSVAYPVTLPAAATPPTATKLFNAAVGTGVGGTNLVMTADLAFPSATHVGAYTSTWTLTLSSGP